MLAACLVLLMPLISAGQLLEKHVTVNNKDRLYLIYVPTGYDASKFYPVLFMFHGIGSDAATASGTYYGWNALADQKQFIAVYPDSRNDLEPKDIVDPNTGQVLYDNYDVFPIPGLSQYKRWDIANVLDPNKKTQDILFIESILSFLKSNYKISENHVYFTGHSYGALFSYYASMVLQDKVTAAGGQSGGLVTMQSQGTNYYFPVEAVNANSNPSLKVPYIILHSSNDGIVPYSWSQTLQQHLTAKGHPNKLVTLNVSVFNLLGHGWDKSKDIEQWNWFMQYSAPLPQPTIACYKNSDCGTDTVLNNYCSGSAVKQDVKVYQCLNAGTANSSCTNSTQTNTLQTCTASQVCENAQCKNVACFSNSDCGVNGLIGNKFCKTGDVFQQFKTYACNNAGTSSASCSNSVADNLVKDCSANELCSNGDCKPVACFKDSDCGSSEILNTYCSENAVKQDVKNYSCLNAGTLNAACSNAVQTNLLTQCTQKQACEDTQCKDITCFADSECGSTEYLDLFCSANDVFQNLKNYSCSNAGTTSSKCSSSLTSFLKEDCAYGCNNNSCFTPACTKNSDCGADGFVGEKYCKDSSVYQQHKTFQCLNASNWDASCSNALTEQLVEQCSYGCTNGACNPKPEVSVWNARYLTLLGNYTSIQWNNTSTNDWFVQFDYGNSRPLVELLFSLYPIYDIKGVDVTQTSLNYWWAVWDNPDGRVGVYRQDSYGNNKLTKQVWNSKEIRMKGLALLQNNPYLLFEYKTYPKIFLAKFNANGVWTQGKVLDSPNITEKWASKAIASNYSNKLLVLWEKDDSSIQVWGINPVTLAKQNSFSFKAPAGYAAKDLEVNGFTYVLLADSLGNAKIWKISSSGVIISTSDLPVSDNFKAHSIEIRADGKLDLMVTNDFGKAQVWVINQNTGAKESSKDYAAK